MQHVLNCTGHKIRIPNIVNVQGIYLTDESGKRYVDMESGVWCTALGHQHPRVAAALHKQLMQVSHVGFCYTNAMVEVAAKAFLDVTGLDDGQCVFLCSGSEGIELARQISKHVTGRSLTVCLHDAYLGSYSAVLEREQGWHIFDWRDCQSCPCRDTCDLVCEKFAAIPDEVSEFVFEPGSASGFVRFPPVAMIVNLVAAVRQRGGKIIVNDVTTGMGRTGKWFGFQHYPIVPDFVAAGKGIGNGYPVSALAVGADVVQQLEDGDFHYMQSHQNDPLGAAVAAEVVATMQDEDLISKTERLGAWFGDQLHALRKYTVVTDVRGRGLIYALEFTDADIGDRIYQALLDAGYIVCNRGGLFRIDPPLTITQNTLRKFIDVLDGILQRNSWKTKPPL